MRLYVVLSMVCVFACDSRIPQSKTTPATIQPDASVKTSKKTLTPTSPSVKTEKTTQTKPLTESKTPRTAPVKVPETASPDMTQKLFVGVIAKSKIKKLQGIKGAKRAALPKNKWTVKQKTLVTSMSILWESMMSRQQRLGPYAQRHKIKFVMTYENDEKKKDVKTVQLKKGQSLQMSDCDNVMLVDAALCSGSCCTITLLDPPDYGIGQHNSVSVEEVCFDTSRRGTKVFPLKSATLHLDQCDGAAISNK